MRVHLPWYVQPTGAHINVHLYVGKPDVYLAAGVARVPDFFMQKFPRNTLGVVGYPIISMFLVAYQVLFRQAEGLR